MREVPRRRVNHAEIVIFSAHRTAGAHVWHNSGVVEEATRAPRLAELCGVFSLASDLAVGQRLESGIRSTLVSMHLAGELGLSASERSDVYYLNLLRMAGCTATPQLADSMGDIRALGRIFDETATDFGDRRAAMPL